MLCFIVIACDDSATSPTPLNLTGTWSGQVGQPMSGSALGVTWTATHAGTAVAGPATLVTPMVNVRANGGISATLTGSQLALAYLAPSGSVQGFHDCAISGSGAATVSGGSITGTLRLTLTACEGAGFEPTESDQIRLSR
jgi:hypothetical protein